MLSHYTFDTDYSDSGPVANSGTAVGTGVSIVGGAKIGGGALSVGGSGLVSLVNVGNSQLMGLESLSVAYWLKLGTPPAGTYVPIIYGRSLQEGIRVDQSNFSSDYDTRPASGPVSRAFFLNDSAGAGIEAISNPTAVGQWVHVAMTTDITGDVPEDATKIYINGVLGTMPLGGFHVDPANIGGVPVTAFNQDRFAIGGYIDTNGGASFTANNFVGLIDDFQLYSGVLTQEEISAMVPPSVVPGDFDGDGDVDGADFVAWQTHFPTASGATLADGDADGDGDVDGADFVVWQTNFPFTPGPGVSPMPEPQSIALAALGVAALVGAWKRRVGQSAQR